MLNFNIFWNFFAHFFCYAVSSCVYGHSHPYLVSVCFFLAGNKAFPYPRRVRAILWDAATTCSVVIFEVVAAKKRSPNLSVSWLTLYGLVDQLPVSAGNFTRALQRHFLVDFQTEDIARKIFSCSKRACFAFVNLLNPWDVLLRHGDWRCATEDVLLRRRLAWLQWSRTSFRCARLNTDVDPRTRDESLRLAKKKKLSIAPRKLEFRVRAFSVIFSVTARRVHDYTPASLGGCRPNIFFRQCSDIEHLLDDKRDLWPGFSTKLVLKSTVGRRLRRRSLWYAQCCSHRRRKRG